MLRLVHPAPQGKGTRPPKGSRAPSLSPTPEERKRIKAAVRNIARAYGGYAVLVAVTELNRKTLEKSDRSASFALAIVVARAAGIPVETILSGVVSEAGRCAVCGRKGAP